MAGAPASFIVLSGEKTDTGLGSEAMLVQPGTAQVGGNHDSRVTIKIP